MWKKEASDITPNFFRKGIVGDYKNFNLDDKKIKLLNLLITNLK